MAKKPKYPEHEKLHRVVLQSQSCGEFLDWLNSEKRVVLAQYHKHGPECEGWDEERRRINRRCPGPHCEFGEGELYPAIYDLQDLLAEFFGVDRKKLEAEKRQLLEEQRRLNEGSVKTTHQPAG